MTAKRGGHVIFPKAQYIHCFKFITVEHLKPNQESLSTRRSCCHEGQPELRGVKRGGLQLLLFASMLVYQNCKVFIKGNRQ